MGNAIGAATAVPKAAFTHGKSKTRFAILGRDKEVVQQIERGRLSAEYRVAYRIGSGNHAGEARISSPTGISIAVYDRPREDLRVVSHVEQLALSECARQSPGAALVRECSGYCGTATTEQFTAALVRFLKG